MIMHLLTKIRSYEIRSWDAVAQGWGRPTNRSDDRFGNCLS